MKRILTFLFSCGIFLGVMFAPAGRWDWEAGWWCLGLNFFGFGLTSTLILRKINPDLQQRRRKVGRGTPAWDFGFILLIQATALLQLVVASLDQGRVNGGPTPAIWWLGVATLVVSCLGVAWALASNPFFEATVRHQTDRLHRIVRGGPYGIVRHPGYFFALLRVLSVSFCTGSMWSLLVWLILCGLFVLRIVLEEEFLLRAFPQSYREYKASVRFRLLPGLW